MLRSSVQDTAVRLKSDMVQTMEETLKAAKPAAWVSFYAGDSVILFAEVIFFTRSSGVSRTS